MCILTPCGYLWRRILLFQVLLGTKAISDQIRHCGKNAGPTIHLNRVNQRWLQGMQRNQQPAVEKLK